MTLTETGFSTLTLKHLRAVLLSGLVLQVILPLQYRDYLLVSSCFDVRSCVLALMIENTHLRRILSFVL
jgi:hypothetical protein